MKRRSVTIVSLTIVCSMAAVLAYSDVAFGAPLACCNPDTRVCVNSGAPGPQFCNQNACLPGWLCKDFVSPCGGTVNCLLGPYDCEAMAAGCCSLLRGQVVDHCAEWASEDPDATDAERRVDDGPVLDGEPQEESNAPATESDARVVFAWALVLPLLLLVPAVPIVLRRRRKT